MRVGGERHAPAALPVPIVQEAGWAPGPVWTGAENLASTGTRSPDRPARSESLYRLSYPGPPYIYTCIHTYIHIYIHTYVRTYIHTYIHIYIQTYIHIYTSNHNRSSHISSRLCTFFVASFSHFHFTLYKNLLRFFFFNAMILLDLTIFLYAVSSFAYSNFI